MKKKLSFILILIIIINLSFVFANDIEEKIDEIDNQIKEKEEQTKDREKEIEQTEKEVVTVKNTIEETIIKKQALDNRIKKTTKDIKEIIKSIDLLKKRIVVAKKNIQDQEDNFSLRLRNMYYKKDQTFWEVIFDANGIEDLLVRISSFRKIAQQDDKELNDLVKKRDDLAKLEKRQEKNLKDLEELEKKQKKDKVALEELENELNVRKKELEETIKHHKNKMAEEKAQAEKLQAEKDSLIEEARRIAAEKAAQNNTQVNIVPGSGWAWPVPSSTYVSYGFGYRIHPLYGTDDFHSGIDILGNTGDAVVAARGGLVIVAGWYGGFGQCVVIDHGDGVQSLYAHGSSVNVSVGDIVSQGDVVIGMGTTGVSTAVHLHFSVLVNGEYVDPAPYIGL